MRLTIYLFLLCFFSLPVSASQPIWKSMTECSALNHIMHIITKNSGREGEVPELLLNNGNSFREHAYSHAKDNGVKDQAIVDGLYEEKLNEWGEKLIDGGTIKQLTNMNDMHDWANYCRKMGKEYKVID